MNNFSRNSAFAALPAFLLCPFALLPVLAQNASTRNATLGGETVAPRVASPATSKTAPPKPVQVQAQSMPVRPAPAKPAAKPSVTKPAAKPATPVSKPAPPASKAPAKPAVLSARGAAQPAVKPPLVKQVIQRPRQIQGALPTPTPVRPAAPRITPTPVPTVAPTVMFPFALPPFDSTDNAVNVAHLNEAPAGKNGFVSTRGEHFVDGQGKVLRFWGVNLNFNGVFPEKKDAPRIAARLAKFGFNAVRLHHYEGNAAPTGIWKSLSTGSSRLKLPREFDPEQLDKFDFFVSELIKRGIYINLNLHVARKTSEIEGVSSASRLPEKDKGVSYFDPKLIQLQKDFARQILTHVNPYTKRALKDEPGVCAVEIANENSLLGMWLNDEFGRLPSEYSRDLRDRWNNWLEKKYTPEKLRSAWTEINAPVQPAELLSQPLPPGIANPNSVDARNPVARAILNRLYLNTVTGAQGRVEIADDSGPTINGFITPGITVFLERAGTVAWAFQLNRDGLDLGEAQPHVLTFWARSDSPRRISVNLWQDRQPNRFGGFTGYADLTSDWQKFDFVFRPSNPDPEHMRLSWNLGNQTGVVQMGGFELHPGGTIAAPPEWTLGHVPIVPWKNTPVSAVRRDFSEFLGSIESAYVANMLQYLRTTIGVKAPIWTTQAQFGSWGGVLRESAGDAIDVHAYWKHPDFGGQGWSGSSWKVGNVSMTTAAGTDPLTGFSLFRLKGKPFVMTEWNSGQPNDFGAESLLMVAALAAWQDWASIYLFDYHSSGSYDRNRFENFFSIDTHPAKMATATAAALLYRRNVSTQTLPGDMAPAQESTILNIPRNEIWNEVASFATGPSAVPAVKTWRDAGGNRLTPLLKKNYVVFGKGLFPRVTDAHAANPVTTLSDTQQLAWDSRRNIFSVNTPRTKLAIGFLGGRQWNGDEFQIEMPPTQSNWATWSLSSLDGQEISRSKKLLLSAVGKAENMNMGWNADRSSVGNEWGTGPTRLEGIYGNVKIATDMKTARVFALDETGARRIQVTSTLRNGVLSFMASPTWRTPWYEIAAS